MFEENSVSILSVFDNQLLVGRRDGLWIYIYTTSGQHVASVPASASLETDLIGSYFQDAAWTYVKNRFVCVKDTSLDVVEVDVKPPYGKVVASTPFSRFGTECPDGYG
jgi:hypothetical protein